jgi:hypothetical protein
MPDEPSEVTEWPDGSIGVVADGDAIFVVAKKNGKAAFVQATEDESLESAKGIPDTDRPNRPRPEPPDECPGDRVCRPVGSATGWRHSDYITEPTLLRQRLRLRLHVAEVSDHLAGFQSRNGGDGWSYSRFASLADYLQRLKSELAALDRQAGHGRRAAFLGMR